MQRFLPLSSPLQAGIRSGVSSLLLPGTRKGHPRQLLHFFYRFVLLLQFLGLGFNASAESQKDYKGITDPFGDPNNYEFSADEQEDKEFFHLGRFIMLGFDAGVGIFTGGLGATTDPALAIGGRFLYFMDRSLAIEAAFHYSNALNAYSANTTTFLYIQTEMLPLTLGMRYYFPVSDAPRALALANPYIAIGLGDYLRTETVLQRQAATYTPPSGTTSNFGFYLATGIEFPVYMRHVYMGLDLRYAFTFFVDRNSMAFTPGDRNGNYFIPSLTLTYNF